MYIPAGYRERLRLSRSSSTAEPADPRSLRSSCDPAGLPPALGGNLTIASGRAASSEAGIKLLTSVTQPDVSTWRARPRVRGRARYSEAVMVWTINASAAPLPAALR